MIKPHEIHIDGKPQKGGTHLQFLIQVRLRQEDHLNPDFVTLQNASSDTKTKPGDGQNSGLPLS